MTTTVYPIQVGVEMEALAAKRNASFELYTAKLSELQAALDHQCDVASDLRQQVGSVERRVASAELVRERHQVVFSTSIIPYMYYR